MKKEEIRDKIISIVSQIHDCVENVKILDYKPEENLNKIIELINVDLTNIAQSLTPQTVDVEDLNVISLAKVIQKQKVLVKGKNFLNVEEKHMLHKSSKDIANAVIKHINSKLQQPKEQKEVSDEGLSLAKQYEKETNNLLFDRFDFNRYVDWLENKHNKLLKEYTQQKEVSDEEIEAIENSSNTRLDNAC